MPARMILATSFVTVFLRSPDRKKPPNKAWKTIDITVCYYLCFFFDMHDDAPNRAPILERHDESKDGQLLAVGGGTKNQLQKDSNAP